MQCDRKSLFNVTIFLPKHITLAISFFLKEVRRFSPRIVFHKPIVGTERKAVLD
jgi:hypothetical protein